MSVQIKLRRGTEYGWSSANIVLASGEAGYELDTGRLKIGDGSTAWNSLDYTSVIPSGFIAGSGINLILGTNGSSLTIETSGIPVSSISGLNEAIDDRIGSGLFVAGTGINLVYDDISNSFTIATTGVSFVGHTHTASNITDFNSSVSGLLPSVSGSGYVSTTFSNNIYTVQVTGLQPSGSYASGIHTHVSSDITDFNSSVSGLLPVKNISSGSGINVLSTSGNYTIAVSGLNSSYISDFNEAVDDRIGSGLFVAGTGINLSYIDGSNTFTVSVTGLINNANDNRILTSRDSTTTGIDAETNLTFDGSLLSVGGDVVTSGHFGINTGSTPYPRIFGISEYIHIGDGINDPVYISASDGNASFANSKFTIGSDGNLYASSGNFTADATGSGYFASDLSVGGNLFVNNIPVSVSGHSHTSSDITDFNSSVSGLLPVKNISSGSGINVSSTTGNFTISVSGLNSTYISDFNEAVDDRIGSGLFVAGTGISLVYNDSGNSFTVSATGLIANPSNNRILTSRDSTSTGIDAESNLIFDGSLLTVSGNLTARTGILDILSFNTNNGAVSTQGQIGWNNTEGTVDIAIENNLAMQINEHRVLRIRNTTGSTLYKGQVVYASGVHPNGIITPNLYVADGSIQEIRFIGMMLADVNINNNGFAIDFGHVNNIDTRGNVATNYAVGDETWADGDILYVHPTVAGKLTKVEPKHAISVAYILDAANNGKIFVRPTSFGDLNYLHDVNTSGATNGQFLQYNSVTDYWVPSSSGNFTTLLVNGTGVSISGHTHTASQITDFNEAVDDRIGSGLFAAGTGINLNYNDAGNSFTVSVTGLVNNPTNNRILTSRDSTTTGIDAESDLTFENKTLNIGSSGNAGTEAIINLYTNDGGDGEPSINFKDYDDNTKLKIYWDNDENTSYVYSLNDTLVLSGPTNYIGINNDGTINIVSSGVTSNNNFSITNQTANTIASFDANKNVTSLDTGTYPNLTELSYVKGVTSAIQTQLNAKQNTLTNPVTGTGIASHVAYWNSSSGIVADSGQLYWDATNNRLGIGTSTPSGQLHVIGTGNFSQNLHIGAPANTGVIAGLSTTSTVPALSFQSVTANHTSASHTIFDFRKNISTRVLYIDGAGSTTIDATNGNLVVPSTTPSAGNGALIAHGMRRATTTAGMDFAWGESISSITEPGIDLFPIGGTHISSGILFRLSKNSTKSNVAMLVDGNGKVGIGTASPQQFVHISGNFACGSEILRLQNSGVYLGIGIGASGCFQNYAIFYRNENRSFGIIPGTENVIFFSGIQMAATKQIRGDNGNASITLEQTANGNLAISAASGIKFQSSSVDKMTLTSDGKLGIGTTTPSGTLHVVGTGNITTVNTIPTFLQTSALTTNTNNWNPGYGDIIRVSGSTGGINITGLTAPTGLGSQYVRIVINTGPSHNLTINHQSASSSSENRFITSTGGDHIIPPTGTVSILYDTVDSRWRIL